MEQAINQFTKGLQLDTHPMVQGNDTLTDCLNGTLITMNGNEVILQNDMGNRRVDNAFLPSGYQPVGMKEYGGIIYIAAYNPITNKSQIGSFPSPQRKVDGGANYGSTFNFNSFINDNLESFSQWKTSVNYLKQDSFLVPLTKDNFLHAGDKFAIYADGLSEMEPEITNYNNASNSGSTTKAFSPKNRKYTLSVGILNSQNEFVDITKTLARWKKSSEENWIPVNYTSEYSDVYKFNDGYFISDTFDPGLSETINDANFIKNRQKMVANTYSYKLAGPMYLKVQLNHIQNFDYNITGTYDGEKATIQIEAYVTYNCPDNPNSAPLNNGNEDYRTFDEVKPGFKAFNLISNGQILEPVSSNYEVSTYNPATNLYTTKITKTYENVSPSNDSEIFNYFLGVIALSEDGNDYYLKGLSVWNSLDLSLLDSGKVFLKGWKFYNQDKVTILKYSLNAYPKIGESFKNLRFKFFNVINPDDVKYFPKAQNIQIVNDDIPYYEGNLSLLNGRQTVQINWEEIGLSPNQTYGVEIYYDVQSQFGDLYYKLEESEHPLWLLTTELFNDLFNNSNIDNYCTTNDELFTQKLDLQLVVNDSDVRFSSTLGKEELSGSLVKIKKNIVPDIIEYSSTLSQNIQLNGKVKLEIQDQELYPDYVRINNEGYNIIEFEGIQINSIGSKECNNENASQILRGQLKKSSNYGGNDSESLSIEAKCENKLANYNYIDLEKINLTSDFINYNIKYSNYFVGKAVPAECMYDVFDSFSNIISSYTMKKFAGFRLDCDEREGPRDRHWVDIHYDINENIARSSSTHESVDYKKADHPVTFKAVDYLPKLFKHFEDTRDNGQVFMFIYPGPDYPSHRFDDGVNKNDASGRPASISNGLYNFGRIWWRTNKPDKWALLYNLYNSTNNTVTRSDLRFKQDYIYRAYDVLDINQDKIYTITENYQAFYEDYNIPLTFRVNYKLNTQIQNINSIQTIEIGENIHGYGNLVFKKQGELPQMYSNSKVIQLKSSEEFTNKIRTFNPNGITGIELTTGLTEDSDGNSLDRNSFYYLKDGELIRLKENPGLQILDGEKSKIVEEGNSKNVLVLSSDRVTSGTPFNKCDSIWTGGDGETHLDYTGVPVIDWI